MQEWRHRWPSAREDGVEAWDDIVQSRLVFFEKFQTIMSKQLDSRGIDTRTEFALRLDEERAHNFRSAATGLTKQGAYDAAQKYLEEHHAAQRGPGREKQDYESIKSLVKLRCLQADRVQIAQPNEARDMLQQVLSYISVNVERPGVDQSSTLRMDFKLLQARVSVQLSLNNLTCLRKAAAPSPAAVNECLALLGAAYVAYSEILSSNPSGGTMPDRQLTKVSLKFGQFCDELLQSTRSVDGSEEVRAAIVEGHPPAGLPGASSYPALVVRLIMNAIVSDTSLRARHGVARLLSLVGQYPETHEEFRSHIGRVPSWVFIPWIPQMLALMDQAEGGLFVGILEDIARSHPQALYFGFHVSEKDFGPEARKRTQSLAQLLINDRLRGFIRALEDLTFPEQRLRDALGQIKSCVMASDGRKAQVLFAALAEDCLDEKRMGESPRLAGEYNCKFSRDWSKRVRKVFGEDGSKLLGMDEEKFKAATKELVANLTKAVNGLQSGVMSLGLLSQWMAKFDLSTSSRGDGTGTNGIVEIPGQYDGFRKPSPSHHVKLAGFDQILVTMTSKQKPKVVTMRGSDEKEYKFLVKGGEDIRLDQRIEQLFEVMNGILRRDAAAARRGLEIRTFSVVPVSKSCGLLQFVENTSVLEDVVQDGLVCKIPGLAQEGKSAPAAFLSKLKSQYQGWVTNRGGPTKGPHYEPFTNLYTRADHAQIGSMLSGIASQLPWDTFRAGVARWATSAESYLALRSRFARSLAAVSICGYVAGVGDRHLGNTLVDMRSGSLVAIDFGYSFGTGVILLPVPELIPFRLTPQLTNFLLPLDAIGLLRTDMVRVLGALRGSRDVISAVMDVFVKEPLVDWKTEAMKARAAGGGGGGDGDGRQEEEDGTAQMERRFVELKVENAQRKLQLWNPAAVTVAELRSSVHARKPYSAALEGIVRGGSDRNVRARVQSNTCRSVLEQVDCLIDQATDPNLLGRTWTGWQAWV